VDLVAGDVQGALAALGGEVAEGVVGVVDAQGRGLVGLLVDQAVGAGLLGEADLDAGGVDEDVAHGPVGLVAGEDGAGLGADLQGMELALQGVLFAVVLGETSSVAPSSSLSMPSGPPVKKPCSVMRVGAVLSPCSMTSTVAKPRNWRSRSS
jgi:hypothetical protein